MPRVHSDKTAKTGFVGFGSTSLGLIGTFFWAGYFSASLGAGGYKEGEKSYAGIRM